LEFSERKSGNTLSEVHKLVEIVITPLSTIESEQCCSTLKRVKTYLKNSIEQEHLNAVALLSIHKDVNADTEIQPESNKDACISEK
jgi:hypothetical protein